MEGFIMIAAAAAHAEEKSMLTLQKRMLRDTMDPFQLPTEQFLTYFRLSKDLVKHICNALRVSLVRERSHGLSVESQVLAALRFFAVGSYQGCVGQDSLISMSQPSVSNAIHAVARGIRDHLGPIWVTFPTTADSKIMLQQSFLDAHKMKGVIGCIDCTHIAVIRPSEYEESYVNHKGFHSLNVEMIASYDLQFLGVNARFPGSVHDAFIWRNSPFRREIVRQWEAGDHNSWLLGDSGYPLEPWLMTPVLNAQEGSPEERYTAAHCRTRSCVERAFGVLKNTFRCLLHHRVLHTNPINASAIVSACVVLHNMRICNRLADEDMPQEAMAQEEDGLGIQCDMQGDRQGEAIRIRNSLIRNFVF